VLKLVFSGKIKPISLAALKEDRKIRDLAAKRLMPLRQTFEFESTARPLSRRTFTSLLKPELFGLKFTIHMISIEFGQLLAASSTPTQLYFLPSCYTLFFLG
jgi:hypothetical protein